MSTESLGLIIDDSHQPFLDTLQQVPVSYCTIPSDIPETWIPPLKVRNQGRTNSCAGHTSSSGGAHSNYVITGEVKDFSPRFAYITSQLLAGFRGDNGTSIASTVDAFTKYGCCLEADCPFTETYSQNLPSSAYTAASQHKHHGDTRFDCRDWNTLIAALTDFRCVFIGTTWYTGQGACTGIEDLRTGKSGAFRGYHARLLSGWSVLNGIVVPSCLNSHGVQWANKGRSLITPDLWDYWRRDSNFCAFMFNAIDEVVPTRKSLAANFSWGDAW